MKKIRLLLYFSVIVLAMGYSSFVRAGTVSGVLGGNIWTGWTQFQDNGNAGYGGPSEDWVDDNKVYPGYGGQGFDAEYLFYKLDGDILSLGLQTGFDIVDGKYRYYGRKYFAGDLALSFDGPSFDSATDVYSHAVDFGLKTKDYFGHKVAAVGGYHNGDNSNATDIAGLYSVTDWNNHIILPDHATSNPFAMDGGFLEDNGVGGTNYDFTSIDFGSSRLTLNGDKSYYRQVSFDISDFRQGDGSLSVDAHWVMSCGNDAINGSIHESTAVPEPTTIALLGIGLAGLAGAETRRRRKKKAVEKS